MKKTLTVNLGGTIYRIDEDAYNLLDTYLKNLRYHFRKEEGADEIIADMESRIGEHFDEILSHGLLVITIDHVEQVIEQMGKPEQLNGGDADADSGNPEADKEKKEANSTTGGDVKRRLFRNPDDRVLGGVASGLAAYLGWDATWMRLGLVILGFSIPFLFLFLYVIAWIVVPLARTATDKLQMKGEPINVENIGKTVTDGFEKVSDSFDKVSDAVNSQQSRSGLHRIGSAIISIVGFCIKVFLVVIGVCCIPVLFVGLMFIFALLMIAVGGAVSVPAIFYQSCPDIDWSGLFAVSPAWVITFCITGVLAIGIPVVGIIQLIMQAFKVFRPMSQGVKLTLVIVWIISVAMSITLLTMGYMTLPFLHGLW